MKKDKLTRQELYDLVWSEPMLKLSKKYSISDVGLRKICVKLKIPLPKAGHWQKLQFGKKVTQPPLPDFDGRGEIALTLRDGDNPEIIDALSPIKLLQKEIENTLKSQLNVPDRLTNPDELVIAAREALLDKSKRWLNRGLTNCSRKHLDINVSPGNIPRSLRFWDTLIKAFRARGYDTQVGEYATSVIVLEDSFKISLREATKRVIVKEGTWDRTNYILTGILCFQLRDHSPIREWKDGKHLIEQQISKIIAQVEVSAQEKRDNRIHWAKQEAIRKEKERIQKEFEKRQETDLFQFKEMLGKASRWHKANNLRKYIEEVEAKAAQCDNLPEQDKAWIEWARKKADWYDPFIEAQDELLDEVDREILIVKKKSTFYGW